MNNARKWYAVYTKPRSEKKVSATLDDKGIHTYCPTQKVRKKWSDRFKIVEEPIFRSYVFIYVQDDEKPLVLSDYNVLNFVQHCGKPAVIQDYEIQNIQKFLGDYSGWSFSVATAAENDLVRIESGPFMDYTGIITHKSKTRASIRLELFNAYLVAEFMDTQYSKIN
jgi:transcription antitermination factor NusG